MQQYTFRNGAILDRPLQELISDSIKFIARGYTDQASKDALRTSDTTSPDKEYSSYSWLSYLFSSVCNDSYRVETLHPTRIPRDSSNPYDDREKAYAYLVDTPQASLKSLFSLLVIYQDVIKYEKNWRAYYTSGLLDPVSTYLAYYMQENISSAAANQYPGQVCNLFVPSRFLELDMEVEEILEASVRAGLTTRFYMQNVVNYFHGGRDYWIFSCLITPELTEQFLYEYLTLDRKPTYFSAFSVYDLIFSNYTQLRLNPNIQKASAHSLARRLKKFNSYHIEKLRSLLCLVDDVDAFAIDLMALQMETDSYARAKRNAEAILTSHKQEWNYGVLGLATPTTIIDKYKAYVTERDQFRKVLYEQDYKDNSIAAITAIQNVFIDLHNTAKNLKYFGYSEWVWDVKE